MTGRSHLILFSNIALGLGAVLALLAAFYQSPLALALCFGSLCYAFFSRRRSVYAEEIKRGEERYQLLAELSPLIIWTVTEHSEFKFRNQSWFDYTGIARDKSKAGDWVAMIHPDDRAGIFEVWSHAVQHGTGFETEVRYRRGRDGEYRWHLSKGKILPKRPNEPREWQGVALDIHERILIEESLLKSQTLAENANLAKTRFLANISHEIRTPISAIMGFLEILREPGLTMDQIESSLAIVDRNSKHLLRLIDDLLDSSKLEAGKMTLEHIDYDIRELLGDLEPIYRTRAETKGIRFNVNIEAEVPPSLKGDPGRLRQILGNVVSNAIRFTDKGRVDMLVQWQAGRLTITVLDTGRGISAEQAMHLFQPFTQADLSTTRRYGGTGLGLALARGLARLHSGDLRLKESALNQGSTFEITLSAEASHAVTPEVTLLRMGVTDLSGMRVLVVEDTPDTRLFITSFLERAGATVETAADGREGVERAMVGNFDVVLMDMQMPWLDGLEATRELRRSGFMIPIVALTAHAQQEERLRSLEAGCNDHITKPIERQHLIDVVARHGFKSATTLEH
ncbi:MAG: response regulator [Bdellovibrionota bacterium]